MENKARELDQEMRKEHSQMDQLRQSSHFGKHSRNNSYEEAESEESSVFSMSRLGGRASLIDNSREHSRASSFSASLNSSFESSQIKTQHDSLKKSVFATKRSRFARSRPETQKSFRNRSQGTRDSTKSSRFSGLFSSRLNTSIFNRRMIFPGEHGIFGAKTENEFLEDKSKMRKVIRKKLFAKSYIKEVDGLLKELKVGLIRESRRASARSA